MSCLFLGGSNMWYWRWSFEQQSDQQSPYGARSTPVLVNINSVERMPTTTFVARGFNFVSNRRTIRPMNRTYWAQKKARSSVDGHPVDVGASIKLSQITEKNSRKMCWTNTTRLHPMEASLFYFSFRYHCCWLECNKVTFLDQDNNKKISKNNGKGF